MRPRLCPRRALLAVLFVVLGIHSAVAQYAPFTGSRIVNSAGLPLPSGTLNICPVTSKGVPLAYHVGGGGTSTSACVPTSVTNGAFSTQLPDTMNTVPQNVCFALHVQDPVALTEDLPFYTCVQPSIQAGSPAVTAGWCAAGGACNLDLYNPSIPALPVQNISGGSGGGGGGSFNGGPVGTPISLPGDPTADNQAANKHYVDLHGSPVVASRLAAGTDLNTITNCGYTDVAGPQNGPTALVATSNTIRVQNVCSADPNFLNQIAYDMLGGTNASYIRNRAFGNWGPWQSQVPYTGPTLPASPDAAYSFNETSGTTLRDASGHGRSITLPATPPALSAQGVVFYTTNADPTIQTGGRQITTPLTGTWKSAMVCFSAPTGDLDSTRGIGAFPVWPTFLSQSTFPGSFTFFGYDNYNTDRANMGTIFPTVAQGASRTTTADGVAGGPHCFIHVRGASADTLYVDGKPFTTLTNTGSANAIAPSNPITIGGPTDSYAGDYAFIGTIHSVVLWQSAQLTPAQVGLAFAWANQDLTQKGLPIAGAGPTSVAHPQDHVSRVGFFGDSVTGCAGVGGPTVSTCFTKNLTLDDPTLAANVVASAVPGGTGQLTAIAAPYRDGSVFDPLATHNIAVIFNGINDLCRNQFSVDETWTRLVQWSAFEHSIGSRTIVATMPDLLSGDPAANCGTAHEGGDQIHNEMNATIRKNYAGKFDGIADLASVPLMGCDGCSRNSYFADNLHPSASGNAVMASVYSQAVNRLTGSTAGQPNLITAANYAMAGRDSFVVVPSSVTNNVAFVLPSCFGPTGETYSITNGLTDTSHVVTVQPEAGPEYLNGTQAYFSIQPATTAQFTASTAPNAVSCGWYAAGGLASLGAAPTPPPTSTVTLVNEWKMNEGQPSTFSDSTTPGTNTLTQSNIAFSAVSGFNGYAANFNGSTSRAFGLNQSTTNFTGTAPFSACAWVDISANNPYKEIASTLQVNAGVTSGWELNFNGGVDKPTFVLFGGGGFIEAVANTAISENARHHVCAAYSGSGREAGVSIFVDGASVATTSASDSFSGSASNTQFIQIGSHTVDNNAFFPGVIADVRIYTGALAASDVSTIYAAGVPAATIPTGGDASLVDWWKMNEGAGTTFANSAAGASSNAVTTNQVSYAARAGFPGLAAIFNGSGSNGTGANQTGSNFNGTSPMTVCSWINISANNRYKNIIGTNNAADASTTGWSLNLNANTDVPTFVIWGSSSAVLVANDNAALTENATHQLCATYSGNGHTSGVIFYVDGVGQATYTGADSFSGSAANSNPVNIGVTPNDPASYFAGAIGDVRIYNRVLSAQEISTLYAGGAQ